MFRTVVSVILGLVLGYGTTVAFRLPRNVQPTHYELTLVLRHQPKCLFSGNVLTTLKVINNTDNIWLHSSKFLDIDESSIFIKKVKDSNEDVVNGQDSESENSINGSGRDDSSQITNITLIKEHKDQKDAIRLDLGGEELEKDSTYILYIAFNGTMNRRRTAGIYCRSYREGNDTKWFSSASFEPTHARTAFPCWDEPGFKANVTLSIAHEERLTAISNMPLKSSKPYEEEEDWILDTFHTTPPISTYLLSFLLSNFANTVTTYNSEKIKVWSRPGINERSDFPLRMAARHLAFLEKYTAIEDPMPKQDFLAIRNYIAGGLENWGIISFEERLLLFDPKYRRNKQVVLRSCNLVAHELAHIWFGNLVTPEWWDDIWLSEGFSSYFAALSTAKVYPEWSYDDQAWAFVKENAMAKDTLPTTHPLKLDEVHSLKDVFDEITYHKGHCIVHMLNGTLGEDALRDGIQSYLNSRKYGVASHSALWSNLQDAARKHGTLKEDLQLDTLMNPWISLPGYPVVYVERDYEKGEFTISQTSILDLRKYGQQRHPEQGWWIPISFTYKGDPEPSTSPKFWLGPDVTNFTMKDPARPEEWLLVNVHGAGYYRTKYDVKNTRLLMEELSDLPVEDRVQIVSDILEIALYGPPISMSLQVILFFKTETSPFPWFPFLESTPKMARLLRNTELEDPFKNLLRDVLSEGMKNIEDDSPHRKEMIAVSCKFEVPQCADMALEAFNKWLKNPNYEIREDTRYSFYCLGVKKGNESTWNTLLNRYNSTEDIKHKKDLLKALSCTEDQKLLERYLSMAMNENTNTSSKSKTSSTILKAISKNNPDLLLKALASKTVIPPKTKSSKWQKTLENLAIAVNNEKQLDELRKVLNVNSDLMKSVPVNDAVLDIAEGNLIWLENNEEDIKNWFKKRN